MKAVSYKKLSVPQVHSHESRTNIKCFLAPFFCFCLIQTALNGFSQHFEIIHHFNSHSAEIFIQSLIDHLHVPHTHPGPWYGIRLKIYIDQSTKRADNSLSVKNTFNPTWTGGLDFNPIPVFSLNFFG